MWICQDRIVLINQDLSTGLVDQCTKTHCRQTTKSFLFIIICLFSCHQHCLEIDLPSYVANELKVVQEDIVALENVSAKIETEMQKALKTKGQFCVEVSFSDQAQMIYQIGIQSVFTSRSIRLQKRK